MDRSWFFLIFFTKVIKAFFPQDSKCHLVAPAVVDLDPSVAMKYQPGVNSYYMVGKVKQQLPTNSTTNSSTTLATPP